MDTELGLKLFKRFQKLESQRENVFDPSWQEISQYFSPDLSDIQNEKTEGTTGWFDRIFDSAPVRAASTCSVGVRNWVTPSTDPWLGLAPPTNLPKLPQANSPRMQRIIQQFQASQVDDNGMDDSTKWLNTTAEELNTSLSSSNFYSVIQPFNRGACTFGTALLFCGEGKEELFYFEQFKVGTFCIAENDQKIVDTVFRKFRLTVRQAVQKFCTPEKDGTYKDLSNLPGKIAEKFKKEKFDETFEFIHCVYPNEDYKQGGLGKDGMTIASVYLSVLEKKVVQQGGYEEMPYFCLRWSRWGTDDQPYGCSPAFETLMEARQLNYIVLNWDSLVELKAFPRFLYPDNLDGQIQLAAGSVTFYQADKPNAKPEEWATAGDEMSLEAIVERKTKAIEKAFFVPIFDMFAQLDAEGAKTQRTMFEIAQRMGEKLDKFTGTFDQYVTELINPLTRRMLGIAIRAGRLTEPPPALMVRPGNDPKAEPQLAVPKVVINSRVTLALKSLRNSAVQSTLQTWEPLFQIRPDMLDNLNLDRTFRESGRNFGMTEKDFYAMDKVMELRQQRVAQQQQERAMAMAEQAAAAAGKLGKAPKALQDSAAEALMGAVA